MTWSETTTKKKASRDDDEFKHDPKYHEWLEQKRKEQEKLDEIEKQRNDMIEKHRKSTKQLKLVAFNHENEGENKNESVERKSIEKIEKINHDKEKEKPRPFSKKKKHKKDREQEGQKRR